MFYSGVMYTRPSLTLHKYLMSFHYFTTSFPVSMDACVVVKKCLRLEYFLFRCKETCVFIYLIATGSTPCLKEDNINTHMHGLLHKNG